MSEGLTIEKLAATIRKVEADLKRVTGITELGNGNALFDSMPVVVSPHCVIRSAEPTFPISQHRSRRIHKKLERRHGPQFPTRPACLQIGNALHVHPAIWDQMKRSGEIRQRAAAVASWGDVGIIHGIGRYTA